MLEVLEMVVKESMCMVIRSIEPIEIRRIVQDFIPPRLSTSGIFSVAHARLVGTYQFALSFVIVIA